MKLTWESYPSNMGIEQTNAGMTRHRRHGGVKKSWVYPPIHSWMRTGALPSFEGDHQVHPSGYDESFSNSKPCKTQGLMINRLIYLATFNGDGPGRCVKSPE